jgi:transaldolase
MAKFLLDSADIEEVKKWRPYIVGMTTNPSLLGKVDATAQETYDQLLKLGIHQNFLFFNQILSKEEFIVEKFR